MKKIKRIFTLILLPILCLTVLFSSCDREEDGGIAVQEEVRFSIGGDDTKSTQTGIFDEGDFIGVFAVEHGGLSNMLATNLQYRFDGFEFGPAPGVSPIRFNGKEMDFYVYAPYDASNNNIRSIRAVAVNQETESGWKASDFVTAVNATGIKQGIVPLHFFHKFATVRLNVEEIPGITGAVMNSVKAEAVLDFATNTAGATGSATTLKMFPRGVGSGILCYELTIPVQTVSGELFTLSKDGGDDVKCMVDAGRELPEGVVTPFGVGLVMDISFTDFPAYQGTATGNGKYVFNSACTIHAEPNSGYHFVGWFENGQKVTENTSYSFTALKNRRFTPSFLSDTTYGTWSVSVSANPTSIAASGGQSVITASALRDVFVKGLKIGTENGTPVLSIDNSAFTLSGNTLSVGNNGPSSRTCKIMATCGDKASTCIVTQAAGIVVTYEYYFSVTNRSVSSGPGAGSYTVSITSYKTRFENGVSTGKKEDVGYSFWHRTPWVSGSNSPTFFWEANTSTSSRVGYAYWIQNESGQDDFAYVEQEGVHVPTITTQTSYEISISPNSYTFASTGGSKTFSVSCTKVVRTYSDGSLIRTDRTAYSGYSTSVSGSGFSGSGTTVSASRNNSTSARSGTFTVSAGGYSASASLSQEGAFDIGTDV